MTATSTDLSRSAHPAAPLPPKWVRKPAARPEEVLQAALDVFTLNGFSGTRMEDIAKAACLSKAAIYLYFPSKEDVFKALVEQRVGLLQSKVAEIGGLDASDPVKGLRVVVQAWALATTDRRMAALPRIILAEAARFPALAAFYHRTVIEHTHGTLIGLIQAGIDQAIFRRVDPAIAARALVGPLIFESLRRQAFGETDQDQPLIDMAQTLFDMFLHGMINPEACATPPGREGSSI
jgi:AcrR family transcriptional regulator